MKNCSERVIFYGTRYANIFQFRQVEMKTLKNVMSRITLKPEQTTTLHHNLAHLGSDINQIDKTEFKQIFTTIDSLTTSEVLVPVPPGDFFSSHLCFPETVVRVISICYITSALSCTIFCCVKLAIIFLYLWFQWFTFLVTL